MKTFLDVLILMTLRGYHEGMKSVPDESGIHELHDVKSPFYKGRLRGILQRGTPPPAPSRGGQSNTSPLLKRG